MTAYSLGKYEVKLKKSYKINVVNLLLRES
jgi:hypothetical protein